MLTNLKDAMLAGTPDGTAEEGCVPMVTPPGDQEGAGGQPKSGTGVTLVISLG